MEESNVTTFAPIDTERVTDSMPVLRDPIEDLWDVKRLAKFLGLSYDRTMRLVHDLKLPYSQWGGKTSPMRFRPEAVRRWVIQHELPHEVETGSADS